MLIVFFYINEIVLKVFVLAGQARSSAYCCDVLRRLRENVRRLLPELWRQKNCHFITTTHCLTLHFHQGIFNQKIKLKGHHFDTIEGIEAETQAVLNTLREHDFKDAFKKLQKR
jgi:hypothetical protein